MDPEVSVVVPAFNAARTLADAVASVRAQDVPCEIVVVDDGSTDATPEVIAALGVIGVRQENRGPAAARNRGLELAAAPLIAFIDDDDVWEPGRLRRQQAVLESDPAAGIVLGHTAFSVRGTDGCWIRVAEPRLMYHLGAALVRREVFDAHGGFDPSLRASEDVDWFLRVRDAGVRIVVTEDVVQLHRRNGENMTRGRSLQELQFIEVVKRSLDRRRSGGPR